jgi:SAM-dependent methyltransferase
MNIENIAKIEAGVWRSGFNRTISPNDTMALIPGQQDGLYFATGASGLHNVLCALSQSRLTGVRSLLDMGCGHGRVGRFFRAAFPESAISFCEIYPDAVKFCAETFSGTGIQSDYELTQVELGGPFDVIWCGSLFTHLDLDRSERWVRYLCDHLTADGVFVGTFHGSLFSTMKQYFQPLISPETFDEIAEQYQRLGIGYGAYNVDNLAHQGSVGVSVWRPSRLLDMAWSIPGFRVISYTERGWADAQDVLAIARTDRKTGWLSPVEMYGDRVRSPGS